MNNFINDLSKMFKVEKTKSVNVIKIDDVPFSVSQKNLDSIRKSGGYERYLNCVKIQINANRKYDF